MDYEKIYKKYNSNKNIIFKFQESTSSMFIAQVKKNLLRYVQNIYTYDELKTQLSRLTRDSDSKNGIVSDTPQILQTGKKFVSESQIRNLILYACDTLSEEKYFVDKAKKALLKNNELLIKALIYNVQIGNKRNDEEKYDYEGFLKVIK